MKYKAKYLPVEGEIKKGDKYRIGKSLGLGTYEEGYIGTAAIDFLSEAQKSQDAKILKLFLISSNIKVGDKYKCPKFAGSHEYDDVERYASEPQEGSFKVIGEILTPGIKEGQEFTEKEVEFLTIG
jgi:hypothetical protein